MLNGRRKFIRNSLLSATAMALSNPVIGAPSSARFGIVGQFSPELEIDYWIDENGDSISFNLTQHRNKWIFLKCFQSWCPGCHSHGFPALKKISDALQDNPDVVFAAIQTVFEGFSINTKEKLRKIQLQYELHLPMGHDPGSEGSSSLTMKNFRTGGTPWMILINPQRQVVFNDFSIDADNAIRFLKEQTK